jgi:hypothetical protein
MLYWKMLQRGIYLPDLIKITEKIVRKRKEIKAIHVIIDIGICLVVSAST